MTSTDEIKLAFEAAKAEIDHDNDIYLEAARKIVNVERQSIYGDEPPNKRLKLIREIISEVASEVTLQGGDDENQTN